MDKKTVKLVISDGKELELPILEASEGINTIDIRKIYGETGYFTFDPGFVSTASCESKITYINGDTGELKYCGYPVEQLAENSHFEEVCYLLFYGELPSHEQLTEFKQSLAQHSTLDEKVFRHLLSTFDRSHHPMAMLMSGISYLSGLYHSETDIHNPEYREKVAFKIIAQIPILIAWIFRYRNGQDFKQPDKSLNYAENFLYMSFDGFNENTKKTFERALDLILILHADHEQNASTSTVRLSGSTETNPFAALTAGVSALWGPAHGGANEAVIDMLDSIVNSGESVERYIERAKDKEDHFKLMGFGHRIYKNYDPRAKIIRQSCHSVLKELGDTPHKALLETALSLEKIALNDEYFIERKLYPNVDFYSGIIFTAMDLPSEMYTTIFALSRTSGWISHWNEMMADQYTRIGRPRQLYKGAKERKYVPLERR